MFEKKIRAEDFSKALVSQYIYAIRSCINDYKSNKDIEWPETLQFEMMALLFFAFDLGMSSIPNKTIGIRVRDGFLDVAKFPDNIYSGLTNRNLEYSNALNSRKNINKMMLLGNIFAKYVNFEDNALVVGLASSSFQIYLNFVIDVIKKHKLI
jgi:hypothetical protein